MDNKYITMRMEIRELKKTLSKGLLKASRQLFIKIANECLSQRSIRIWKNKDFSIQAGIKSFI